MREPFFSVLVTAYNRPREIDRCVRSCLAQTYAPATAERVAAA
jgi:glycosyltransferase involved in cell wall biosynthesis